MTKKRALILGIGGQDGSYLADLLLDKGYEVHGLYRHSSYDNLKRIEHCRGRLTLHQGDITDIQSVKNVFLDCSPDEIYNVADQDHIGWSLKTPSVSWDVTAKAPAMILEMLKDYDRDIRFFQPVSSTIFGDASAPQDEETPFNPMSPYAVAKAAVYHAARYYRQVYGMFVAVGIMYNHDSPRRCNQGYLLHEICSSVKRVLRGEQSIVEVGDPEMTVDIGYAEDYMVAAWRMLQMDEPGDYVIASGEPMSINDLVLKAMYVVGVAAPVVSNPELLRPGKQPRLVGDASKAKDGLGWWPRTTLHGLIASIMEVIL